MLELERFVHFIWPPPSVEWAIVSLDRSRHQSNKNGGTMYNEPPRPRRLKIQARDFGMLAGGLLTIAIALSKMGLLELRSWTLGLVMFTVLSGGLGMIAALVVQEGPSDDGHLLIVIGRIVAWGCLALTILGIIGFVVMFASRVLLI